MDNESTRKATRREAEKESSGNAKRSGEGVTQSSQVPPKHWGVTTENAGDFEAKFDPARRQQQGREGHVITPGASPENHMREGGTGVARRDATPHDPEQDRKLKDWKQMTTFEQTGNNAEQEGAGDEQEHIIKADTSNVGDEEEEEIVVVYGVRNSLQPNMEPSIDSHGQHSDSDCEKVNPVVSAYLVQDSGEEEREKERQQEREKVEALERTIQQYQERDNNAVYADATVVSNEVDDKNRNNAGWAIIYAGIAIIMITVVVVVVTAVVLTRDSTPTSPSSEPKPDRVWQQVGVDIEGEASRDQFGSAVALSNNGSYVAIGGNLNDGNGAEAGHVRVFRWSDISGNWTQVGQDIDGEREGDKSGLEAVAISAEGSRVAIGARFNSDSAGHVRVYDIDFESDTWIQVGEDIDGEYPGDQFGVTLSMSADGNCVAVGAHMHRNASGEVIVFDYDVLTSRWVQVGASIVGDNPGDRTGTYVDLSADGVRLAVTSSIGGFGQVYQRDFGSDDWILMGQNINLTAGFSTMSTTISADGSRVAFGEPMQNNQTGHVRVFDWNEAPMDWIQVGTDIDGENTGEQEWFGISVSISDSGTRLVAGAPRNDNNGMVNAGHARVFDYDEDVNDWKQVGMDIDGKMVDDESAYVVTISGNGQRIAVGGSRYHGDDGIRKGHARIFEHNSLVSSSSS